MGLNDWQIRRVEEYVRAGCDPAGPVYGDMLDHLCCLIEERMVGSATFEEVMAEALEMMTCEELKQTEYETLELLNMETICSKRTARWVALPYALICTGFFISLGDGLFPRWLANAWVALFMGIPLIMITVHGIAGWQKNFPRWSFAVIGITLWMICNTVRSIFFLDNFHSGNWLMLGIISAVILLTVSFHFSLEPLREIWRKTKRDPWLILFAFYPLICWLPFRFMDGFNSLWRISIALAVTALFAWGFIAFLSNENRKWRIAGLLIPMISIPLISWLTAYIAG